MQGSNTVKEVLAEAGHLDGAYATLSHFVKKNGREGSKPHLEEVLAERNIHKGESGVGREVWFLTLHVGKRLGSRSIKKGDRIRWIRARHIRWCIKKCCENLQRRTSRRRDLGRKVCLRCQLGTLRYTHRRACAGEVQDLRARG